MIVNLDYIGYAIKVDICQSTYDCIAYGLKFYARYAKVYPRRHCAHHSQTITTKYTFYIATIMLNITLTRDLHFSLIASRRCFAISSLCLCKNKKIKKNVLRASITCINRWYLCKLKKYRKDFNVWLISDHRDWLTLDTR